MLLPARDNAAPCSRTNERMRREKVGREEGREESMYLLIVVLINNAKGKQHRDTIGKRVRMIV